MSSTVVCDAASVSHTKTHTQGSVPQSLGHYFQILKQIASSAPEMLKSTAHSFSVVYPALNCSKMQGRTPWWALS